MYYIFNLFIVLIGKIIERAKSNLKDLQKYINSWYTVVRYSRHLN